MRSVAACAVLLMLACRAARGKCCTVSEGDVDGARARADHGLLGRDGPWAFPRRLGVGGRARTYVLLGYVIADDVRALRFL